ncbi:MAG: hypothetical protein IT210_04950 [Armatimonadetes bacterium]|nr:hypothetical protein [Armatimonadota bacterium]
MDTCARCQAAICFREQLLNAMLGIMEPAEYRCLVCLAAGFGRSEREVYDHLGKYLTHRPCFLEKWVEISPCAGCEQAGRRFCPPPEKPCS